MNQLEAIKHNYLFRGLPAETIDALAEIAETREFAGGETIVRQFDRNNDLMILLSGEARIKTFSGETIAELGSGSIFGEVSLVDDGPRSATVVAAGTTTVLAIPGDKLRQMMDRDSNLRATLILNIARVLAQRLRTANIQLDAALQSEVARARS